MENSERVVEGMPADVASNTFEAVFSAKPDDSSPNIFEPVIPSRVDVLKDDPSPYRSVLVDSTGVDSEAGFSPLSITVGLPHSVQGD